QPWLAKPTWNGVLSSSWWNRSMCGPLLMLASHYTDTRFVTMARMGGLSWYRFGIWPCTRYGGRDRGESGESAARTKYHSHDIPCPVMSSLVSASCTLSTGLYRVYSPGYAGWCAHRLIVAPRPRQCLFLSFDTQNRQQPNFHRMTLVTTACW